MNDHPPYSQLEDCERLVPTDRHAAMAVAKIIDRYMAPTSILDLGCGNGVWLSVLANDGERQILGVEEARFAARDLEIDPAIVVNASLARPLDLQCRFDLVICLEGLDHVEPEYAATLVDNCIRHADAVLFAVGLPNAAESAGRDAKVAEHWIGLFRGRGFRDLDLVRPLIWHDPRIPSWYRQNLLLFVKNDTPRLAELRAVAERAAAHLPKNRDLPEWLTPFSVADELDQQRPEELARRLALQADELHRSMAEQQAAREASQKLASELECLSQHAADLSRERHTAMAKVNSLANQTERLRQELAAAAAELERTQSAVSVLRQERALILGSTVWRVVAPLRKLGQALPIPVRSRLRQLLRAAHRLSATLSRPRWRRFAAAGTAIQPGPVAEASSSSGGGPRMVVISGEAHTPGHVYRVVRAAKAAAAIGANVSWMPLEDWGSRRSEVASAQVVMIWRAPHSAATASIMRTARETGAKVVFDLDDLMLKPELARVDVIDGIRSQNFSADETARLFARIQKAMLKADICTCTTNELADHIREYQKIAYVIPNGFDEESHLASRLAVRRRRSERPDGLIRIGYASGSRTHQRDFAQVADALARILAEYPDCRLVLFRDASSLEPVVNPAEFEALLMHAHQIEWRDMVPLERLPSELVRFDINLVPLETGNPFCEAKSELKYFEAALVQTCTIASRTGPMQRAIHDRTTGRLADGPDGWYQALNELVQDDKLRQRLGNAAYLDVLWRFGPQRREELFHSLLSQLSGGAEGARAFELELRHATRPAAEFDIPDTEVMFAADAGLAAEVTVMIPLYNYAQYVEEALESVRLQSIEVLDLIVVDDCSTDHSLQVALDWADRHVDRFNRILVVRNAGNAGLARSRNVGFNLAETPFVLPLDADNRLLPTCCAHLLDAMRGKRAAFAYPKIQCFGDDNRIIGDEPFLPARLCGGNYIDAMALICKWAWAGVGGYTHIQYGWEDYDFWCRCVEFGFWGIQAPEVLAEYRVHNQSMLQTSTDRQDNKLKLLRDLGSRHTWLSLPYRA